MASNEPQGPTPGPPGDPEPPGDDALRRLEQRLDRASAAAERLIAEAAVRAAHPLDAGAHGGEGRREPPPAGWQIPDHDEDQADGSARHSGSSVRGEVDLFLHVLSSLRDRIPPELQHRLGEAIRELLMALRALIDWYLERSEHRRAAPVEVQDIPIT